MVWIGSAQKVDYRLPFLHEIRYYNLTLELNPDTTSFKGELVAAVTAALRTKIFVFQVSPSRITVNEILYNNQTSCNFSYIDERAELMQIECGISMEENIEMFLVIKYEGVYGMNEEGDRFFGFYKSSYTTTEGNRNYTFTMSEPIYARASFPCFDEPNYKSEYHICVNHPEKYHVLVNTGISIRTKNQE